jgi:hypothetical protein
MLGQLKRTMSCAARPSRSAVRFAPSAQLRTAVKRTTKAKQLTRSSGGARRGERRELPVSDDTPSPATYTAAAGLAGVAAATLLASPSAFWEVLGVNPVDIVTVTGTSTQVWGAYFLLAATGAARLAAAADAGRLSSSTYVRLNQLLAAFFASVSVPLAAGVVEGQLAVAPAAALATTSLAVSGGVFARGCLAGGGSLSPIEIGIGLRDAVRDALRPGSGLLALFYAANFFEDAVLGLALLGGPILPTVAGAINGPTLLAKDLVGSGTLLYAGIVWLLLDARRRGRLEAATFRALNAACGAVSAAVGAVCVAGQAAGIATNDTNQTVVLVSCAATAAVFGWQALRPAGDEE